MKHSNYRLSSYSKPLFVRIISILTGMAISLSLSQAAATAEEGEICESLRANIEEVVICDSVERLLTIGDITFRVPDANQGVGLVNIHSTYDSAGPESEGIYVVNTGTALSVFDMSGIDTSGGTIDACADSAYVLAGFKESSNHPWYFNNAGAGTWVGTGTPLASDLTAANNIETGYDSCGLGGNPTLQNVYMGSTSKLPDLTSSGSCESSLTRDGTNVHGWSGSLASGVLARTCFWTVVKVGLDELVEADIAYNPDYKWFSTTPTSCGSHYDFQSVAMHEWGHVFGLGHATPQSTHGNLTMSPSIAPCSTSHRTLGKGDLLGLLEIYP